MKNNKKKEDNTLYLPIFMSIGLSVGVAIGAAAAAGVYPDMQSAVAAMQFFI